MSEEQIFSAVDRVRASEPLRFRAQVVVVGLGAGGSMVLRDLAMKGVDVLGVEVGEDIQHEEMNLREEEMMPRLFAEAGARATSDFGVTILQGRGVGGSTLHNTNLCKRLPEAVLEEWARKFGLRGLLHRELQDDFQAVEELLGVHPVPDKRVNPNNALLARGAEALGFRHGRLSHNRGERCQASGFCELGCPNKGKMSARQVLIPEALEHGARVLTTARVDRVLTRNGAVYGVGGYAQTPGEPRDLAPFVIEADRVVLSASATASAAIALRSGLSDPCRLMGRNLHMHPGAIVAGVFDKPGDPLVQGWQGVPQSVECTEFLDFDSKGRRAWLVSGFGHPVAASLFVPGFGPGLSQMMRLYPRLAVIIVMLHDHSEGRIVPGAGERVISHYRLGRDDREQLAMGLQGAGRILLAAGASRVMVPTSPVLWASRDSELKKLSASSVGALSPPMVAVHPMSTLWMGRDPLKSVVDPRGEHHHVKGLYVADGSLFPTSIGGPPQIPIYTFGRRVARSVHESL